MRVNKSAVKEVVSATFPDYTGRKFRVEAFKGPFGLESYWDGGTKDEYVLINLATMAAAEVPDNGTPYRDAFGKLTALPLNCAIVKRSWFCGRDCGLTIFVNAENLQKLLPNTVEAA